MPAWREPAWRAQRLPPDPAHWRAVKIAEGRAQRRQRAPASSGGAGAVSPSAADEFVVNPLSLGALDKRIAVSAARCGYFAALAGLLPADWFSSAHIVGVVASWIPASSDEAETALLPPGSRVRAPPLLRVGQ